MQSMGKVRHQFKKHRGGGGGGALSLSLTHICHINTSYYPIRMISRLSEKPCKAKGKKDAKSL